MTFNDHSEPADVEAFAFAHMAEMSAMLHASGARDMALLLDAMGDLRNLAERRAAKTGEAALMARRQEATEYALSQIGDLARLMDEHGFADAALLMRLPAKLQAAADRRREQSGAGAEIYVLPTVRHPALATDVCYSEARKVG